MLSRIFGRRSRSQPAAVSTAARPAAPSGPLRRLTGVFRWWIRLPDFKSIADAAELRELHATARRNVERRRQQRVEDGDPFAVADRRHARLWSLDPSGGTNAAIKRRQDIDAETFAEVNRLLWERHGPGGSGRIAEARPS